MACSFHWVRIVAIVMFQALLWINRRTEGFSGISVACKPAVVPHIYLYSLLQNKFVQRSFKTIQLRKEKKSNINMMYKHLGSESVLWQASAVLSREQIHICLIKALNLALVALSTPHQIQEKAEAAELVTFTNHWGFQLI